MYRGLYAFTIVRSPGTGNKRGAVGNAGFFGWQSRRLSPSIWKGQSVVWLPVVGWEGLYEVSDRGQVQSQRGLLHPFPNSDGYLQVSLCRNGYQRKRKVHRLVLEAFADLCPEGQESRHGPGGLQDNRWPENLCWGTKSENNGLDKHRDGTTFHPSGSSNGRAKLSYLQIYDVRLRYATTAITQQALADELGVSNSTVSGIVTGARWRS